MKVLLAAGSVLTAVLMTSQAFAFDQARAQQACGNDVFSLCGDAVPDHNRIAACLRQNFKQVSPVCRQFMADTAKEQRQAGHRGGSVEMTGAAVRD